MGSISAEIFSEFTGECDEILRRLSRQLSLLEEVSIASSGVGVPAAVLDAIPAIYRDVHTLKGSANLFGYRQLSAIAHAMESRLEGYRDEPGTPIPRGVVDALFACLDLVERIVRATECGKSEPDFQQDLAQAIERLERAGTEDTHSPSSVPGDVPAGPTIPVAASAKADVAAEPTGSIRVQVSLLDRLMNLVGEMVLVRNQVMQYSNRADDLEFIRLAQRLDVVTSEIQEDVMLTRMQPIGNVLEKFHRMVRDLGRELGKEIQLVTEGATTELDKTLLEAIRDPLTHLVRNACDHGIETPEARAAGGKPARGTIRIRAFQESGQVVIEVGDDGRGLDRARILEKAVERGIVKREDASRLTDREVHELIFRPGFTTASAVTTVSGRGVGMDVVRTNIERIGGTVELSSVAGRSTAVLLWIPLTLAIVPAMIVRAGPNRFAIPQVKLVELVRASVGSREDGHSIEFLQGRPMIRLRGRLLALVDLATVLGGGGVPRSPSDKGTLNIVVVNGDGAQFGIIVDEILDTVDIVVKPLTRFLKALSVYSGATLLGDGSVALILDIPGLSSRIRIGSPNRDSDAKDARPGDAHALRASSGEMQEFLLFRAGTRGTLALTLGLVHRLEEFDRSRVEFSGRERVIRYRDTILPLIELRKQLGAPETAADVAAGGPMPVIVVRKFGRSFGIVVDEIVDIVSAPADLDDSIREREVILGNLLLRDQVVVVIDPLAVVEAEVKRIGGSVTPARKSRVLLVEDTPLFRKQIRRTLGGAGYEVTEAVDGAAALELLESGGDGVFEAVVSDIEMPRMDGYQFARAVRNSARFSRLPLVAVTTRQSASDIEEGRRAGFDLYFEKFNADQVLDGLAGLLRGRGEGK